ncbi:type I-E CRISPR-associated protein Cse1/CasA [Actinokineospora globicatena]|uniref:Type I-E CRISPR-associated protein Cse1/CasA n=1 Tax=Actinokineospora globicatena TaxID=103729 RepID=A0A9W6QG06_9PSEU|nr:type I-E CRISPR-associated protein Cse1/CasA [Actinokineospora globicatena]GLW89753.1 type I-E CRISPR-associated protein Cse1/CasA [Actinokineospora globicatena]
MNDSRPSFDLVDSPWIPVRHTSGRVEDVSMASAFEQAHEITDLVAEVPTQVFALTRLLLAVLHRAVRGPRDIDQWKGMWATETLPIDDISTYLDRHRDRWDLFHPETPFFQIAGLRTAKGEWSDLDRLLADVPNGHLFFTSRIGAPIRLSPAEAARWVVHCHAFDPSGIKSGAVGDDRVKSGKGYPIGVGWSGNLGGVLVTGSTLKETLLLNLRPHTNEDDLPPWERPVLGPGEDLPNRPPSGLIDLFTWQSRRILLRRDGDHVTGVLIANGDRRTPQNMHPHEPNTAWRRSPAQEKKLGIGTVYMPLEHRPERDVWRGLQAFLPEATTAAGADRLPPQVMEWVAELTRRKILPRTFPLGLRTIGVVYGSQQSVITEVVDDAISMRAVLLAQDAHRLLAVVKESVSAAEATAAAVGRLASDLAVAAGSRETDGHRARAAESTYSALDPLFRDWLAGLGPDSDPDDRAGIWHQEARIAAWEIADRLLASAPMAAWVGRPSNGKLITSTHARSWFAAAVRKALPRAHVRSEHNAEGTTS